MSNFNGQAMVFTPAAATKTYLRLGLCGVTGGGKTYTALTFAFAIAEHGRVAVIDTENGSASKYRANFPPFDVLNLGVHSPLHYAEAISAAEAAGYEVLVIDSLSHAWNGYEGALEQVDKLKKASRGNGNQFQAWAEVTPHHNTMIRRITGARMHIIATMRTTTEYQPVEDGRGRTRMQKVGLKPVQRDGLEYEFDIVGDMAEGSWLSFSKCRCPALTGTITEKPGAEIAQVMMEWLNAETPAGESVAAPSGQASLEESDRHIPDQYRAPIEDPRARQQNQPPGYDAQDRWQGQQERQQRPHQQRPQQQRQGEGYYDDGRQGQPAAQAQRQQQQRRPQGPPSGREVYCDCGLEARQATDSRTGRPIWVCHYFNPRANGADECNFKAWAD